MKKMMIIAVAIFAVAGCTFLGQVKADKKLSDQTPLAAGEVSPYDKADATATKIGSAASNAPYGSGVVLVPLIEAILGAGGLGGYFYSWRRGVKLRKAGAILNPTAAPVLQHPHLLDGIVQHLADVSAGLFTVGQANSAIARGWKMSVLSAFAIGGATIIHQTVIPMLNTHPPTWLTGTTLSLAIGALAAIEKSLQKVPPPVDVPPVVSPVVTQ